MLLFKKIRIIYNQRLEIKKSKKEIDYLKENRDTFKNILEENNRLKRQLKSSSKEVSALKRLQNG